MLKCVEADCGHFIVEFGHMHTKNHLIYSTLLLVVCVVGLFLSIRYLPSADSSADSGNAGNALNTDDSFGIAKGVYGNPDNAYFIIPVSFC